jgi:hypothetical protein
MNVIYLTEEQLVDILTTMYNYGLIDLRRAQYDMPYVTERVKMYLEAKAIVDDCIRNN